MPAPLRDIDLALASVPEPRWLDLAGPVLLADLQAAVGIDDDELRGAYRRALYVAAAMGDPSEASDPTGPAVALMAEELATRERRLALADAVRGQVARATAAHLPRAATVLRQLAAPSDDPLATWQLFCAALYARADADDDD